jgi:hypothetical protein
MVGLDILNPLHFPVESCFVCKGSGKLGAWRDDESIPRDRASRDVRGVHGGVRADGVADVD